MQLNIQIPKKFKFLLSERSRFKVVYGGRGSGKSENIARALIILSLQRKLRILCAREYQTSIHHSVHQLLADIIDKYDLYDYFRITNAYISSVTGSEFIFKGITNDPLQIKSLQGVDICWVEEAEKVSNKSWDILTPTIRNEGSEIWVSFNPQDKDDPTYKRFIDTPMTGTMSVKVNYDDNPFFEKTALFQEMEYDKEHNPELYQNKWLGNVRQITDALIFKNKYDIKEFKTPDLANVFENRFYMGVDWGFSNDPTAMVRCFIQDNCVYVDQEAGGIGINMQELKPLIFDKIDESIKWPIFGDSARPETISYMAQQGYNIKPCSKYKGSVEEGIELLRSFKKIIIHPRCKNLIEEMGLYSYKIDRVTEDILPVVVDKYNHYIDAFRYALNNLNKPKANVYAINI